MSDYNFMLDDMTWSFSRLSSFENCKYEWYLNYIEECDLKEDNIYAEFGSFCHKILEQYCKQILSKDELLPYYIEYFDDFVTRNPWNESTIEKLYDYGFNYFGEINFDPEKMDIIGVEQEFEIPIGNHKLKGFIDLLYQENGDIIVCDHKSCEYPFTKKGTIKKGKEDKFDSFKKQLYLYSSFVKMKYGKFPKYLEWNFFRDSKMYRIEFDEDEYKSSVAWANEQIKNIYNTNDFEPNKSFFYCNNLCDFRGICEYRGVNDD